MYTLLARERLLFKLRVCFLKTLKNQKGVLALGNTVDHNYISPAIYPGNKPEKQLSLLFQYHSIEDVLNKFDVLGHNAPWTLAKLREASGIDFNKIKYNDEKVYRMLWDKSVIYDQLTPEQQEAFEKHFDRDGLNNGAPELSTTFLGGMIKNLKPTTFEELVRIEGLSHKNHQYCAIKSV